MLTHRSNLSGGATLACLGLAVVGGDIARAGERAEDRHAQFFSAHGRVVRLLRTFIVTLPLLWTVYGVTFVIAFKIGSAVSPLLGLACLFTFAVACFMQSMRYVRAAWCGVLR